MFGFKKLSKSFNVLLEIALFVVVFIVHNQIQRCFNESQKPP